MRALVLSAAAALLAASGGLVATRDRAARESGQSGHRVPFRVGERLTYRARLNGLHAGHATMRVVDIDTIRGRPVYHTVFELKGSLLFFHVDDHYESWFDTASLVSLRHVQHIDQTAYHADRTYEFFPERRMYLRNGVEKPGVAEPLDEGAFVYFMRSVPLEVGSTYQFDRNYHPDRNPVVIHVVRREEVVVPAGRFNALVLEPVIESRGLFSERGRARVWIADDSSRMVLRLQSRLPFGTLRLELERVEHGSPAPP